MIDPNRTLAEKIVARLLQEGLLTTAEGEKMVRALAAGDVRQEDWRVAIENSAEHGKAS